MQDGELQEAPNFVYAPDYTIVAEKRDVYEYPTKGGWTWFDTITEAACFFNITLVPREPNVPQ